jgi:large subunit ribosomal protein L24
MTDKTSPRSPRRQRRLIRRSSIHSHKRLLRCRLDETLREEYGVRSLGLKKGDLVRIMRGQFRDTEAKVQRVDYTKARVMLDAASVTKADGKEARIAMSASNLMMVKLELDDQRKKLLAKKTADRVEAE